MYEKGRNQEADVKHISLKTDSIKTSITDRIVIFYERRWHGEPRSDFRYAFAARAAITLLETNKKLHISFLKPHSFQR